MRVKNEGKIAETLAEVGHTMPPEFELPDSLYRYHLAQAAEQFKHLNDPEKVEAIAVMRTLGEFLEKRAGGSDATPPPEVLAENTRRLLSVAEAWGVYGKEQAELGRQAGTAFLFDLKTLLNAQDAALHSQVGQVIAQAAALESSFAAVVAKGRRTVKRAAWAIGALLASILVLGLIGLTAHAQETGVTIQLQQGGVDLAGALRRGPVVFNCSTNLTCTWNSGTRKLTLVATGGGGGPGTPCTTTPSSFQYDGGGVFGCVTTATSDGTINTFQAGANFLFTDTAVTTKKAKFDLSLITAANTRTIKLPDGNVFLCPNGSADGQICTWNNATSQWVPGDPRVQGMVAHDAAAAAVDPVLEGGYASATAPADVSADGDSVRAWYLRNGGQAVHLIFGGTLYDARQVRLLTSSDVVDVFDRAGRLLGVVYGSQAQQLKQTAVNFNAAVELFAGGSAYDARARTWTLGSGTDSVATVPPSNASTNVAQVGSTNVGSGQNQASTPWFLIACQFNTTPTTITTGNASPCQLDSAGNLLVNLKTALPTGANVIGAVTQSGGPWTSNVTQFGGTNVSTGTGAGGAGIPRVTVSNDSSILGTLANDGAAAGTNRFGTLPCIAQTSYRAGTAATVGRNEAADCGTDGLMWTAQLPAIRPASYSASATVAPAASATDIAVLPGNASNTVLVTKVKVSCTQTTAGIIVLNIIKRSSADTAGTSVGMTEIPDDSNHAAASSAALTYTANPTINATVGNVDTYKLGCLATGTAAPNDIYILNRTQKPIVLRGTAEQLAINLNGATVTGGSVALTYEWIETATILP